MHGIGETEVAYGLSRRDLRLLPRGYLGEPPLLTPGVVVLAPQEAAVAVADEDDALQERGPVARLEVVSDRAVV